VKIIALTRFLQIFFPRSKKLEMETLVLAVNFFAVSNFYNCNRLGYFINFVNNPCSILFKISNGDGVHHSRIVAYF